MPTESQSADSSGTYPRENYFGGDASNDSGRDIDRDWGVHHRFGPHHDYDAKFAFDMLLESGTMLCGETLLEEGDLPGRHMAWLFAWLEHGDAVDEHVDADPSAMHTDNEEVELTQPRIRPPSENATEQRYRKRYNPKTGAITGGEGTWCELEPRPVEKFLGVVEEALGQLAVNPGPADTARLVAERLKRHPNGPGDHDIMTYTVKVAKGKIDENEAVSLGVSQ